VSGDRPTEPPVWELDDEPEGEPFGPGGWAVGPLGAATAGLAAGSVGLLVAELLAGLGSLAGLLGSGSGQGSPVLSVGAAIVDGSPAPLKEWAIATFGTADKLVLLVSIGAVLAGVLAGIGTLARRRLTLASATLALLGAVAVLAVLSRPGAMPPAAVPTVAGVGVAIGLLRSGIRRVASVGPSRRQTLAALGGATGVVLVTALRSVPGTPVGPAPTVEVPTGAPPPTGPAGADAGVEGVQPWVVPTDDFYRIDTALAPPRLTVADWRLRVWGEVERELTIDWPELLRQPMRDRYITLACVSNEVGGDLVGNARWTGWPVRELLARAGVRPGADMVLSRSVDGWTAGTPLAALTDEREALLAVAMNGAPLPVAHGFPVRLVVPGLYGYVSATKWVTELKVTRFAVDQGYWTPRGWSALGPVKTASRIDVPRSGAAVRAGRVAVAGTAWAMHRGIRQVQVRVDDGDWQDARLAAEPTIDAWRQWVFDWSATAGSHVLTVRAQDGSGQWQTADVARADPDGATGHHSITVRVG